MRRPIEALARSISQAPLSHEITIGELARHYGETPERVQDAIDVIKIVHGEPTTIPAVVWE